VRLPAQRRGVHLTFRWLDCDSTHTGADEALTSVSKVMDKHLTSPTGSDPLSSANSTVRVWVLWVRASSKPELRAKGTVGMKGLCLVELHKTPFPLVRVKPTCDPRVRNSW